MVDPGAKVWLLAVNMPSAGLMIMSSLTSDSIHNQLQRTKMKLHITDHFTQSYSTITINIPLKKLMTCLNL